jgi:hypothetical protein
MVGLPISIIPSREAILISTRQRKMVTQCNWPLLHVTLSPSWGLRPFFNLLLSSPEWVAQKQSVDNYRKTAEPVDKRLDNQAAVR